METLVKVRPVGDLFHPHWGPQGAGEVIGVWYMPIPLYPS